MPGGAITPLRDPIAHPNHRRTDTKDNAPGVIGESGKNFDQTGIKKQDQAAQKHNGANHLRAAHLFFQDKDAGDHHTNR